MADTNICDVAARAEILDIKQRLTEAEEAIVGKAEVVHAHSAADYVGATEEQLAAIEALAAALKENGDVLTAYAPVEHTHDEYVTADYVTEQVEAIDLSEYYTRTETDEYFATIGYVDDAIADIDIPEVDLTDYVTKSYLTQELNEIALSGEYEVDLGIYALKTDIPTVPTNVSSFANDAGYLTEHQDLSDYALKTDIPTVPTDVSAFNNDAGYLTEHQDLSDYALKTDIPTKVSAFNNDAGYITEHQNLSNYALKTEIPDVSGYQTAAQVQALIDASLASFGNAEDGEY